MVDRSGWINHRPNQELRFKVLQTIFRRHFTPIEEKCFGDYFTFYERELSTLGLGQWSRFQPSSQVAVVTHCDLLRALRVVQSNASSTKAVIRKQLCSDFATAAEDKMNRTLDLVLRLWLMINIRDQTSHLQDLRTPIIVWEDDWNLNRLLVASFPISDWTLGVKESRLHPSFTVAFMVEICGMRLEWTDCIADHLHLDRRTKVLRIFPHKIFLQNHLQSITERHWDENLNLPSALFRETIQSLNLLFSPWDSATNKLLYKEGRTFQTRGPYDMPRSLNLTEFKYWRDRLMELHDLVSLSPPMSWAQIWRDRRNPQQFWTFWIVLLILVLTLISTAATLVQTWASLEQVKLQRDN